VVVVSVVTAFCPSFSASGQTPQPAFYTYQAPGATATAGEKDIALTFDDGPGSYTPQILSVLERYHVPASFFEIGENIVQYPQVTQMLARAGYPVEDHTWTHPDLTSIPASEFPYQIDQTQNEIRTLTGQTPTCVRPPYDSWNTTVLDQIAQRGLTTMSYSIDPRDWSHPGTQAIVDSVVGAAFPDAVVDMHDGGDSAETLAALPQIISDLAGQGYTFVSVCAATGLPQASAVYGFGQSPSSGQPITSDGRLVGASLNPPSGAYWLVAADGGVFSFGDARFFGSMGGRFLAAPVVGTASTPDGGGYWLVAADGGVFSFGDARFFGSMGGTSLAAPVVGTTTDPSTGGYWLLASDGGVFSFSAPFYGSRGGQGTTDRFFTICATVGGAGYLLVGAHST